MKHLLKALCISSAFALTLVSHAVAQTKVVIGHFGDPVPYKALIANGALEKATGWTIEWRQFASGAEVNAAMASGGIQISEIGSTPLSAGLSSGLDYQMISAGKVIDSSEALVTRNGSGIEKPADLKGKKNCRANWFNRTLFPYGRIENVRLDGKRCDGHGHVPF